MQRRFVKMLGSRNDFATSDERTSAVGLHPSFIREIADHCWSIGFDRLICLRAHADLDVSGTVPQFEHYASSPEQANVRFAQVVDRGPMHLRVWERGAALTLASGSGACAAVVNANRHDVAHRNCRVVVDGGLLNFCWRKDGQVTSSRTAAAVYAGESLVP